MRTRLIGACVALGLLMAARSLWPLGPPIGAPSPGSSVALDPRVDAGDAPMQPSPRVLVRPAWFESTFARQLGQSGDPFAAAGEWYSGCTHGGYSSEAEVEARRDMLERSDLTTAQRRRIERSLAFYEDQVNRPILDARVCDTLMATGLASPGVPVRCPDGAMANTKGIPTRATAQEVCGGDITAITFGGSYWVAWTGTGRLPRFPQVAAPRGASGPPPPG